MRQAWNAPILEQSGLLVNLAFALVAALLGGLLALALRQSVILGYLAAGVAIGPFTPGPVGDVATVQVLADIGIILLLFAVGVQLSLRELLRHGWLALGGGLGQVLVMVGVGYVGGVALGFGHLEALFFGAVLSNSSSTVIGGVLGERGETDAPHGRLAFAWSSVQDLSTVVLVVVLSALATGEERLAEDLAWAVGRAAVFVVLVGPVGAIVLPWLFERVAALRNREVFVLTVGAVAFGTALVASLFGLSLALGAFIAGVLLGESELSHRILGEVLPLRDIFAGLFFVSVGMLVDPTFVLGNAPLILATLALIVLAKGLVSAAITLVGRQPVRTALLTGVALGQSAEFSFLMARIGSDVGAVTPTGFNVMLAGAVGSIVLSPLLLRSGHSLVRWIEPRLAKSSLASHPSLAPDGEALRGHAVLCGYGRVGSVVGAALRERGLAFVVIEQDDRLVRRIREQGIVALLGNAANPVLLDRAGLNRARSLILAIPDALAARQIVDYARQVNPRLDIVARTHSAREWAYFQRRGVEEVVLGELELALEMTRHALRRFGVSLQETQAILSRLRERGLQESALDVSDVTH